MPKFQQRPFSITIFVPDGDPDSLRFVEKSNWTGIDLVFNHDKIPPESPIYEYSNNED